MTSVIEFKSFHKSYGRFEAVKNLSFTIPKGKIVGFVGKNGAGKSTTIRSMFDMIHVTNGSITVLGMDSQKDAKAIKKRVSYIPSEVTFYDNVTCMQLLKFASEFSVGSFDKIKELTTYFELDLTKKITELSLGNRKKLSIIQGFIKDCELIVLDEPTNGLDPLMQKKFFELIIKEKNLGKTILLSSHNLSEIEKYCDMVAIIKDGELIDYFNMKDVKIKYHQTVTYTTADGITESYEIDGDINAVIAKLSTLNLTSLEIKAKSMEDELFDYYKEDK